MDLWMPTPLLGFWGSILKWLIDYKLNTSGVCIFSRYFFYFYKPKPKTMKKSVLFLTIAILAMVAASCKKVDDRPYFGSALHHHCPYIEDSVYTPHDIVVDTTKGWEKITSWTTLYRWVNPSDSSDIIVFLPALEDNLINGSYYFSLTAAKKEAAKTGKKLPSKELIQKIHAGLSAWNYAIWNPTVGFYVWSKYFFRGKWENTSDLYGSGDNYCVITIWGGNDPKGNESLIAEYGINTCHYSIGLTKDQILDVANRKIDYICLQIRWAK